MDAILFWVIFSGICFFGLGWMSGWRSAKRFDNNLLDLFWSRPRGDQ